MDQRGSTLCRRCRRLVAADESVCPYCGVSRPGSAWLASLRVLHPLNPDTVIRQIIWLNVAMYLVSLLFGLEGGGRISLNPFSLLSPSDNSLFILGATGTIPVFRLGRWWSLITANYLHGGLLHIFFNMVALTQIAPAVIREYGVHRMVALYTLGGVAGFAVSCFAGVHFTIGASAAVCGLIGAMLYYGRHRGGSYGRAVFHTVWGWAVAIFLFGFLVPGINNWAHGGGMAAGFLLGMGLGYQERSREKPLHRALAWGSIVATLGALLWSVGTAILYSTIQ
jgi:rhomboid protease GluP